MKYNPSLLSYCASFPTRSTDHVVRIPAGITTKDDLCAAFQRQIAVPPYFNNGNWDLLIDALRFPNFELPPGVHRHGRTVLLHQDIPLLQQDRIEAKIYLEILVESIQYLHQITQQKEASKDKDELVAVFPPEFAGEIQKILEHTLQDISISLHVTEESGYDYLFSQCEPDWSIVQQWLNRLDGLTAEYLQLYKRKQSLVRVTYLRQQGGYIISYESFSEGKTNQLLLSSPIEQYTLTHLLQLDDAIQIIRYIYEHNDLPSGYSWYPTSMTEDDLRALSISWYYNNAEEERIERPYEMVQETIYHVVKENLEKRQIFFALHDWQSMLVRQDISLDQRLATLCVVSQENLLAVYDQLLALLTSPQIEERWVSARFLGFAHEEKSLPVLVVMLTENLQIHADPEEDDWIFYWRFYAPKLLRHWQTEPITQALYQALQTWIESETLFDHNSMYWMNFEANLCYELGYRDAIELVLSLPLQAAHHKFLLICMALGYYTRSHASGFLAENQYQLDLHGHNQAIENEIIGILEAQCLLSNEEAQALLNTYHEAFREGEIEF